jgi:hypothetical protein
MNKPEKMEPKHYIYVVFIVTNTNIGKLIRFFTRNSYSHVTLAFDRNLSKMYSFARYHINSPILGGFVTEQPERYLSGGRDVKIKVCRLQVSQMEFERLQKEITYFDLLREEMIYNTLDAILSLFRIKSSLTNSFTCIDFVTYVLQMEKVMSIKELEEKLKRYVIYLGSLKEIAPVGYRLEDEFFVRRSKVGIVRDSVFHCRRIMSRAIFK